MHYIAHGINYEVGRVGLSPPHFPTTIRIIDRQVIVAMEDRLSREIVDQRLDPIGNFCHLSISVWDAFGGDKFETEAPLFGNHKLSHVGKLGAIPPTGYSIVAATYTPEGGSATPLTPNNDVYSFTMPDANVTINTTIDVTPWEGDGSEETPYLIYYLSQLDLLASRVNNGTGADGYSGTYFKLMDNITYTYSGDNENNFTAIGNNDHPFKGHFDGNNKTVNGIRIYKYGAEYGDYEQGLFGFIGNGGEVKNLTLNDANISGYDQTGGIVGRFNGSAITNCHVTSSVMIRSVYASTVDGHGGIAGLMLSGTVSQSTSAATLTCENGGNGINFGGIVGEILNSGCVLSNNLAIGITVPTCSENKHGAIAGKIANGSTLAHNYYVNCTVAGSTTDVGYQNADVTANDGAVPGNVREVKAYSIYNDEWAFIASPLIADTDPTSVENLITTNSTYDLYRLNPSSGKWENWKIGAGNNAAPGFSLDNGRGYLYANAANKTIKFTGANTAFNLSDTTVVTLPQGFNLVGNPFPRVAYINKPYYTLNNDGSAIMAEAVSVTTAIKPCYGVVVQASNNETVTFTTTAPTRQNATNNGGLQIALTQVVEPVETPARNQDGPSTSSGTLTLDNAIVSFNEGSQLGKFYFGTQNANIYIPQDNEEYAIAYSNKQGEMPLNFKTSKDGEYCLSIIPEGVEMSYLHLIDNMTGADVDLLVSPNYTFTAKTTDYESRFKLVFVCGDANDDNDDNETFAFYSNGSWIIANESEATLQVIDLNGRILSSETVNGSVSKAINAVPGVYMIRLINGENVKVQKVIIE
jgi:hypothetical protein